LAAASGSQRAIEARATLILGEVLPMSANQRFETDAQRVRSSTARSAGGGKNLWQRRAWAQRGTVNEEAFGAASPSPSYGQADCRQGHRPSRERDAGGI